MKSTLSKALSLVLLAGLTATSLAAPVHRDTELAVDYEYDDSHDDKQRGGIGRDFREIGIRAPVPPVEVVPAGGRGGGAGRGGSSGGSGSGGGRGRGPSESPGAKGKTQGGPAAKKGAAQPPAAQPPGPAAGADPAAPAPANPVAQAQALIRQKGQRNVEALEALRARPNFIADDAAIVRTYQQRSAQFYTTRVTKFTDIQNAALKPNFSPAVRDFLRANGIDFEADAVAIQKVEVWGHPNLPRNVDSINTPSVFTAFVNAEKGWMFRTRVFRTSDPRDPAGNFVDAYYPPINELAVADRIFISEHLYQQYLNLAGGRALRTMAVADIENIGTQQTLSDKALRSGNQGQFARADDQAAFDEIVGGSTGDPLMKGMTDHYSARAGPFRTSRPTRVAYRYTPSAQNRALAQEYNANGDRDAFVVISLS